jgi:GT2 family glycosyltransferase
MSTQVSIIVVNKDGGELLDACLSAIYGQAYSNFEVIVVDNGSTDGSAETALSRFPQAKVIALNENLGFAAANNIGIQHANGEYIVLLNYDTEVAPSWLENLVAALRSHDGFDFCASKMLMWRDRDLADACGDYATVEGMAGKIGHLEPACRYQEEVEVFGACAGAAIYRRSMFDDIGFFDEDFFLIHEDTDLNFRARLLGHRCLFVPTAIVYHHVSATIGRNPAQAVYYAHRNIEFVFLKNMPGPLLLRYWPLHALTVWLFAFNCILEGQGRHFLRAKRDALRSLPMLLRKRTQIQQSRRIEAEAIDQLLTRGWLMKAFRRRLSTWPGSRH